LVTLLLILASLWLLAQTINQKSVIYGLLLALVLWVLVKTANLRSFLICLVGLICISLTINTGLVQNWLIGRVTAKLSRDLHTQIDIRHVDFSLFNKMRLEGVLAKDLHKDTLLYAGEVGLRVTDWFFFKDTVVLQYLNLKDATIRFDRKDSIWNYQFLIDYFGGSSNPDKKSALDLLLTKAELSNVSILQRDEWKGEDLSLHIKSMSLDAEIVDFSKKLAVIRNWEFIEPQFSISSYTGNRPASDTTVDAPVVNDPMHLRWNPAGWHVSIDHGRIENGWFKNNKLTDSVWSEHFDGNHIYFYAVNWDFRHTKLIRDTLTAQMNLDTKERCGLVVQKFSAQIKLYPEAMEFANMDLRTEKSRLKSFYAMRFRSFDDMSHYINKVQMEGDFTGAEVDSDDIAFFAPALASWKRKFRITGHIKGPVRDLAGRNLLINAGQNTLLNGDIHLKGLPDIEQTYIEFRSRNFKTTYQDVTTFFPGLKKLQAPRIDRIQQLRFTGDFIGSLRNFVTSGTIETNLGTLNCNLTMKLPVGRPSTYSGTLSTDNFDLGQFTDASQLGKISFQGKVNGQGLSSKTLSATLDGTVQKIEFNDYTYQNIEVNGTVAQNKFNGRLVSADSNLTAQLDGLIDFSQLQPKFDFTAEVATCNLQQLHFSPQDIRFNGKVRFDFIGDDIDNFLGTARIYDASIRKKGKRISFDSLTLSSSFIDSNKTITVISNEFDGALVGSFSIKELPAAFQTFLNRYYPSYVSPGKNVASNQNFSFVITTKNIDEYLDMFDNRLKGFNFSSLTGRIDSKANLLDLNAEIPQFNYKSIAFYNVLLNCRGNMDSLGINAKVADIYVNDSLHFPSTRVQLTSFNDLSKIQIRTSANQTLNAANISAQVQTLANGIHIRFSPSSFDINSKTWVIDKDGQLAFDKNVVTASDLRISTGEQQILISTLPSSQGSYNDIFFDLKKINIGDFSPFVVKDYRLEGLLSGQLVLGDPFGKPDLKFNGESTLFRLDNDSIGRLSLVADYSKSDGLVNASVHSDNKDFHFDLRGIFSTADSSTVTPINITSDLVDTRIDLLQKYLGSIFTNVDGKATGKLQVVGQGSALKYLGDIELKNGSLKVLYTQCVYKIPEATVHFRDGYIDFGSVEITDTLGNRARLVRGKLWHESFKNLRYDFALTTKRLLMLNTKFSDNNLFYGTVIGKADSVTLRGPQQDLQLYVKGEPADSSNLYLPTTTSRESAAANFIVWKVYGQTMQAQYLHNDDDNFNVTLEINANNYANVWVIIDPLTKDIIKANGHGVLKIKVGTNENMDIRGTYEIDRGNYNFTFQTFIHKPFVFKEGAGNFIRWTGDPYNADINIQAIYEAENVQFSDLGSQFLLMSKGSGDQSTSFHGPVWVVATLSNKLMRPDISFQIELPPNSQLKNDQYVALMLQQIQNDPNELNKQVAYLIVFNSFGPLTTATSQVLSPNEAVGGIVYSSISAAISGYLSQEASSAFQKIFKDKSIQVNLNTAFYNVYDTYGAPVNNTSIYDRTNVNLSVMKSFLNERLTFSVGSALDFGLTTAQVQASSVQFLPNISADWKVTPNGRVVLSFFYRDSYNYLAVANHTQNSSGTSISYRRDFDRIDELFKGKKKDKSKKPKPKVVPAEPSKEVTQTNSQ
jgi:TamB, inner membrane protein subunit of TAM complex